MLGELVGSQATTKQLGFSRDKNCLSHWAPETLVGNKGIFSLLLAATAHALQQVAPQWEAGDFLLPGPSFRRLQGPLSRSLLCSVS